MEFLKTNKFKILIGVGIVIILLVGYVVWKQDLTKNHLKNENNLENDLKNEVDDYSGITKEFDIQVSDSHVVNLTFHIEEEKTTYILNSEYVLDSKESLVEGLQGVPISLVVNRACCTNMFHIVVLTEDGNVYISELQSLNFFMKNIMQKLVFNRVESNHKIVKIDTEKFLGIINCSMTDLSFDDIIVYDENGESYVVNRSKENYQVNTMESYQEYKERTIKEKEEVLNKNLKDKFGFYGITTKEVKKEESFVGNVVHFVIQSDGTVTATNIYDSSSIDVQGLNEKPIYVTRTSSCDGLRYEIAVLTEDGNIYIGEVRGGIISEILFHKVESDRKIIGFDTRIYPGLGGCTFRQVVAYDEFGQAYVVQGSYNYDSDGHYRLYTDETYEEYNRRISMELLNDDSI